MGDSVRLEVDDGVGIVRLDRPPANAIDLQLATELNDAIREAADRDEIGSLVLWGGGRIFAAGADIKAMAEWGPDEVRPTVDALGAASDLLAEIPKVSIAAVNGFALGGGLELALGADLRFLADDATVGQPEITLGVIPGAGGTQRLTHMIGPSGAPRPRLLGASRAGRRGPPPRHRRPRGTGGRRVSHGGRGGSGVRPRSAAGARGRQGRHRGRTRLVRS